jgi:hypothetical protein
MWVYFFFLIKFKSMKNKLLPKIVVFLYLLIGMNMRLNAQGHGTTPCPSKFWSHIDCLYEFKMNGYYIDSINSSIPTKQHFHPFMYSSDWYGCWDIPADTTFATYGCGYCGFSDSAIFSSLNLPSTSQIYKFFSINTGAPTGMGHMLFHYEDIEWYHDLHNRTLFIPDIPYCCSSNLPEDCQTCNCGVGFVDWEKSRFAVFPARGPYWNNNCLPPL